MQTTNSAIKSAMNGVNVMLMGPGGSGKTFSIGTLVDLGKYEVFYLGLENGIESLIGYWVDRGKPIPSNLHWAQAMGHTAGFAELLDSATKANTLTFESLTKQQDTNKSKFDGMRKLLTLLHNFVDERTGESFGPVDKWGTDRILILDGLTGLGNAAMANLIGGKAVRSQSDWGVAQSFVMNSLENLTNNCPCHFVLIAHVEREQDQVFGGVKIMPSTLGKAISGLITPKFSDVILTSNQAGKWTWSTSDAMADLKTRNLPTAAGQAPTFAPIMQKWEARKAAMLAAIGSPDEASPSTTNT